MSTSENINKHKQNCQLPVRQLPVNARARGYRRRTVDDLYTKLEEAEAKIDALERDNSHLTMQGQLHRTEITGLSERLSDQEKLIAEQATYIANLKRKLERVPATPRNDSKVHQDIKVMYINSARRRKR